MSLYSILTDHQQSLMILCAKKICLYLNDHLSLFERQQLLQTILTLPEPCQEVMRYWLTRQAQLALWKHYKIYDSDLQFRAKGSVNAKGQNHGVFVTSSRRSGRIYYAHTYWKDSERVWVDDPHRLIYG